MTAPAELLRELDKLPHRARRGRLARLAREGRGTTDLAALQRALEAAADPDQDRLALELADSAGDAAGVLRALASPDADLALYAARLAGRHAPSAQALRPLLGALAPFPRRALWRALALAGREALAAELVDEVLAAWGPAEAALLLPGLGEADAARVLPAVAHALHNWRGLARRHPELVLGWMRRELAALPEAARAQGWARFDAACELLAELRPAALLELGLALGPAEELPLDRLGLLLRREPAKAQALLAAPSRREHLRREGLPDDAARQLRRLPPGGRLALLRPYADDEFALAELLRPLPYPMRAEAFEALFPAAERSGRQLQAELVAVLPRRLRDAEAARIAELAAVRDAPDARLSYLRLRDIDAARPELEAAAKRSKAEERASAVAWLVECTWRSGRGLPQTLAFLERLKNEQDPVRYQALQALSNAPPALYTEADLGALRRQVTWAVEARDLSGASRSAIQRLAVRLLVHHADRPAGPHFAFALWALQALAGQAFPDLPSELGRSLPAAAAPALLEALRPRLEEAAARHDLSPVLTLAGALGRRAWGLAPLQALLERATAELGEGPATRAAQLWLAPPETRDARVRALLDRDPSWVMCWEVLSHLHLRRQDWLDPYLTGRPTPGRFLEEDVPYLLPLERGFARWLPRQQRAFAGLLAAQARSDAPTQERAAALRTMGRLPAAGLADLAPFLASPEVPVAEAALGALAWLSRPVEALPVLLEHLDGDRARVAMYALPRCARRLPPATLAAALTALLERPKLKVTVRKEALRLLGALRPPGAAELLAREWARPELHRDARIAAGHAARNLLDAEAAWRILGELASAADPELPRSLLLARPAELAPAHRPRYAALLLAAARSPAPYVRIDAFTALERWAAVAPAEIAAAAAGRLTELEGTREWPQARSALLAAASAGAPGALAAALRELARLAARESVQPTRARDLPARQRLSSLVEAACALPAAARQRLAGPLGEAAAALAEEPTLWPKAAALRLANIDWAAPEAAGAALLALAREAPSPGHAAELESGLASALGRGGWEAEALLRVADLCAGEAPLLSVRLVAAAGARAGWPDAALARLGALRARPEPAVRLAALSLVACGE